MHRRLKNTNELLVKVLAVAFLVLLLAFLLTNSPDASRVEVEADDNLTTVHVIMVLDTSCMDCADVTAIPAYMVSKKAEFGIDVITVKTVDYRTEEGREVIKRHSLTKIPTVILYGEVNEVYYLSEIWDQIGSVEEEGVLVLRDVPPPFINLLTGEKVEE